MKKVKYIYLSISPYDKGVYQTQIIDWLNLYGEKGLDFELVQLWTTNPLDFKRSKFQKDQNVIIKNAYNGEFDYWHLFPRTLGLNYLDRYIFLRKISKILKESEKVVFFCRYYAADAISLARKYYGDRVIYYCDLRGASAEETLDNIKFKSGSKEKEYGLVAKMYYQSYKNLTSANKVFAVSRALVQRCANVYGTNKDKFVLYPCLSTNKKFYDDPDLREATRKELSLKEEDDVYIYTGSLDVSYNAVESILYCYKAISDVNPNARLIVIAKKITSNFKSQLEAAEIDSTKVITLESVYNQDMVKYLNAADFALLLRANIVLNNVASPVKFAEYQLCGLPVIISEAIYDYSDYCHKNKTGHALTNYAMENNDFSEVCTLRKDQFNRNYISELANQHLSKESHVDRIINELRID